MIVIVEGIDRVGKTTLCRKLEAQGFLYLKDAFNFRIKDSFDSGSDEFDNYDFANYSLGKLDTSIQLLKQLSKERNIVFDRLHLTEIVYGTLERKIELGRLWYIDRLVAALNPILVFVQPDDISSASTRAGKDLYDHNIKFEKVVSFSEIKKKIVCDFNNLDIAVTKILDETFEYDFYFASPFFRESQVEREESLKSSLRTLGYKVYSPKEACFLPSDSSLSDRKSTFEENCEAIRHSRAVFAITDDKDMGTIWEAGYAYGIKKPIIYFAETLGKNQFNLMLACSGKGVFTHREEITVNNINNALIGLTLPYEGAIE